MALTMTCMSKGGGTGCGVKAGSPLIGVSGRQLGLRVRAGKCRVCTPQDCRNVTQSHAQLPMPTLRSLRLPALCRGSCSSGFRAAQAAICWLRLEDRSVHQRAGWRRRTGKTEPRKKQLACRVAEQIKAHALGQGRCRIKRAWRCTAVKEHFNVHAQ